MHRPLSSLDYKANFFQRPHNKSRITSCFVHAEALNQAARHLIIKIERKMTNIGEKLVGRHVTNDRLKAATRKNDILLVLQALHYY